MPNFKRTEELTLKLLKGQTSVQISKTSRNFGRGEIFRPGLQEDPRC